MAGAASLSPLQLYRSQKGRGTSHQASIGILCFDYDIVDPARRQEAGVTKALRNFPWISGLQDRGPGMVEGDTPARPVPPLHLPKAQGVGKSVGAEVTRAGGGHPYLSF